MKTFNVIAAGLAAAPQHLPGNIIAGPSEGTWTTSTQLAPGDSYTVRVYAPHPSPAQLEGAGTDYPEQLIPAYLTLGIPVHASGQGPSAIEPVLFEPFGAAPRRCLRTDDRAPGPRDVGIALRRRLRAGAAPRGSSGHAI